MAGTLFERQARAPYRGLQGLERLELSFAGIPFLRNPNGSGVLLQGPPRGGELGFLEGHAPAQPFAELLIEESSFGQCPPEWWGHTMVCP